MTEIYQEGYLHELYPEDGSKLTRYKVRCQDLVDFLSEDRSLNLSPIKRMGDCASWLEFDITTEQKINVTKIIRCSNRICPNCQQLLSDKNLKLISFRMDELQITHPTSRYLFLTLTVPNCPINELRATTKNMAQSWNRMKTALFKKNKAMLGFIRKLEVTRNSQTNEAHPHYHVQLHVKPSYFGKDYIKQDEWLKMWQRATRNERITQVDIRAIEKGDRQALAEMTKYGLKAAEMANGALEELPKEKRDIFRRWLFEFLKQMKGVRQYSSGGTLKMPKLEDIEEDETAEDEEIEAEGSAAYDRKPKAYYSKIREATAKEPEEKKPKGQKQYKPQTLAQSKATVKTLRNLLNR